MNEGGMDYRSAGIDPVGEERGLAALAERVRRSFDLAGPPGHPGAVRLDLGYFANVVEFAPGLGLAISTDGVGTKLLIAELLEKYDTVGVDCVAMNVNDVACVGARPLTLVDYIAVEAVDPDVLAAIADGLLKGAEEAGISIAGGELAQVREMVRGVRPGSGFDLVGTAAGTVPLDRIIIGDGVAAGDVLIGIPSSGIHSNGLTLARKALFDAAGLDPHQHIDELGRTLGEELLEPTRIYVRPILALLERVADVKALVHISGGGLLNLLRVRSSVGFEIDDLPEPHPIFRMIQTSGDVRDAEMYRVFNMGVGFVAAVPENDVEGALAAMRDAGTPNARVIGRAVEGPAKQISLPRLGLVGTHEAGFRPAK